MSVFEYIKLQGIEKPPPLAVTSDPFLSRSDGAKSFNYETKIGPNLR